MPAPCWPWASVTRKSAPSRRVAQEGNPRPRVFRLVRDRALINRLGFNNAGHAAALARLSLARPKGVLGINVGANKDAVDRAADYVAGVRAFYDVASYFTVNMSSPNTPGLRDLQAPAALDELVGRVLQAREEMMAVGRPKRPVVVKLAPDIAEDDLAPIVTVLEARGVDGIAVSNSTLARAKAWATLCLQRKQAAFPGGRCSIARPWCWRACM